MKDAPSPNRVVRGKSVHQTAKEKHSKLVLERRALERSIDYIEPRFLVPMLESYIEPNQVRKLMAKVKLWIKAGCTPHDRTNRLLNANAGED